MKILLLTNHLAQFGGSEIVTLEVAETFLKIGCDVNIFTSYIDDPVRSHMDEMNLTYGAIDDCPSPENFDIIWSQHQLLPLLLAKYGMSSIENVFLVNASLSPYEPLEIPGAVAEVADMIVANSPETAERLVDLGVPDEKISVFYNAAPDSFNLTRNSKPELQSVLVISNHMPEEIAIAIDILNNKGLNAEHIGLPFNVKKVTPEIISSYDAIISIGKSVQYSLLSETPVYVYDRFGGPGWLNEDNIDNAEKFNFSGRCCRRQLSSETIADELISGYSKATSAIRTLKQAYSKKYRLYSYLTRIIESATTHTEKKVKRQIAPQTSGLIYREGLLSGQLITFYQVAKHQSSEIAHLNSKSADLHSQITSMELENQKLSRSYDELSSQFADIEFKRVEMARSHEEKFSSQEKQINEKNKIIVDLELGLEQMINSTSWKITRPLRAIKTRVARKKT